jgi:uncharacterized protein YbbK (DUF523 family)
VNLQGVDVTSQFLEGTTVVLESRSHWVQKKPCLLKKPLLRLLTIFDGAFSKKLIEGSGVTGVLLKENGIKITSIKV